VDARGIKDGTAVGGTRTIDFSPQGNTSTTWLQVTAYCL